jgi:thiol-disulfide isomerase/thioredoxin
MRTFALSSCLVFVFLSAPALTLSARAEDRNAEAILKDIDSVTMPRLDQSKVQDRAYVQDYLAAQQKAMVKKAELIGELYKADPSNVKLITLLPTRWMAISRYDRGNAKAVSTEIDQVLATSKNTALKTEAAFTRAQLPMMTGEGDPETIVKNIDAFLKLAPTDPRGADLLFSSTYVIKDTAKQTEVLNRLVKDYPNSRSAKQAEGSLKKLSAVGKPFDLEFTDAIKGTEVSMKGLKGKVVVVDFWATWCGPCVAEMPKMKKLYAEFKDKGVEFIGVSLDQPKEKGGLDQLKKFVAENEIAWPQYYQGNFWQSEFSSSWGINSIPCVFIVDADGKLASVNARGKLETMIPELLKKAATKADAGGGGN